MSEQRDRHERLKDEEIKIDRHERLEVDAIGWRHAMSCRYLK
jgi:hypothetical protein